MSASAWDFRTAAANLNIDLVPFWLPKDSARGVSSGRRLGIRPGEPHPVFVGTHEMAHIVLGHTTSEAFMRLLDFENTDRRHEIEAHTVAIMVAKQLKLASGTEWEPDEEFGYLYDFGGQNARAIMGHIEKCRPKLAAAAALIVAAGQREGVK